MANPVMKASYSEALLEHEKSSLNDLAIVSPSSLINTIPAPFEQDVDEPSNFRVHVESTRSVKSASPTPPGTSCEIDELSFSGNCVRRSAMA